MVALVAIPVISASHTPGSTLGLALEPAVAKNELIATTPQKTTYKTVINWSILSGSTTSLG